MKKLRWGVIGAGGIADRRTIPGMMLAENAELIAVMDINAGQVEKIRQKYGAKRGYTKEEDLLADPEVDAVYIATPPSSHATYAIMAMHAGKPCYVEKPLAASYDDCARVNHVSQMTGVPCYVAYYRRYLPYFREVKNVVESGKIGKAINVQIRFSCPPRQLDYNKPEDRPWRLQPDIAGGGYFYDLAPHQLDLLQNIFGVITHAEGFSSNRGGLYSAEDTVSACFKFENGLPGSGSWCFVGHDSAREDRIEIIGDKGMVSFSVFDYQPIELITSSGKELINVPNPLYVQKPLIQSVIETLQGKANCKCTSISATPVNWVMDRILGKF